MANSKVMLVDDDKEFLEELQELLVSSGYQMVAVNDPISALERVSQVKPDVIVLDLKMPNMSGFQLAQEIRHFCELNSVPIIAMSGYYKDEYNPLLNICGIKVCLKKPFNPLDVISAIEDVLKAK
jgi:CheY-like chemotaxis protein